VDRIENTYNSFYIVAFVFVAAGTCSPSRYLATGPFPINDEGDTIPLSFAFVMQTIQTAFFKSCTFIFYLIADQWVLGAISLGVKRSGIEADHSHPISAEVKKTWINTSTPPYAFMA
jgi:hypothetical protein